MTAHAIGVIGTGAMGMGVVQSLRRHGVTTCTRDIRDDANAFAASLGARVCHSPAALAREASTAIILVVDDKQIDAVLFGEDGAANALRPGSTVVVSSTVDPSYVAALGPRLAKQDITLIDAPVSGGPAKAADGTMTIIVSGEHDAVRRCVPTFERIAGRVFVVGDKPGQAATFKIVNNMLAASNLAAGAEAFALAARAGLDLNAAFDVINSSSGASWILADRMPRVLMHDASVRAATKILAKDVALAVALADRLASDAPVARAAHASFASAIAAGRGEQDDSDLLRPR
ncbi:MAG TPA: NAD(P)-dependent oxidoreductase [Casimicrobiaceae bacterium]|nr:NAD(P)-dependent oxidoreductase [Casimicrobiaceae bacterium]